MHRKRISDIRVASDSYTIPWSFPSLVGEKKQALKKVKSFEGLREFSKLGSYTYTFK